jgi:hypothetical protein
MRILEYLLRRARPSLDTKAADIQPSHIAAGIQSLGRRAKPHRNLTNSPLRPVPVPLGSS